MPFLGPLFAAHSALIDRRRQGCDYCFGCALRRDGSYKLGCCRPGIRNEALDGAKSTIKSAKSYRLAGCLDARLVRLAPCSITAAFQRQANMGLAFSQTVPANGSPTKSKSTVRSVPLIRTTDVAGDLLKPLAGSKYADKIEFREYFKADGTQGIHMQTPAPVPQPTEYDQGPGPGGQYTYGQFPTPYQGPNFAGQQGQTAGRPVCDALSHLGRDT